MNKFAEMTTFVSVVDAHSFSEAARRLGTTKSQVSQRIQPVSYTHLTLPTNREA